MTRLVHEGEAQAETLDRNGANTPQVSTTAVGIQGAIAARRIAEADADRADVLSIEQLAALNKAMGELRFDDENGRPRGVPYHASKRGCEARAHLMVRAMERMGVHAQKVFAVSHDDAGDKALAPAGDFVGEWGGAAWWYHVAPIVRVRLANGDFREMVIDPSLSPFPLALDDWLGRMGPQRFERLSLGELQSRAQRTGKLFGAGKHVVFTSSANQFMPDSPPLSREEADQLLGAQIGTLSQGARSSEVHELAAMLRDWMTRPVDNAAMQRYRSMFPAEAFARLATEFPNLYEAVQLRLTAPNPGAKK